LGSFGKKHTFIEEPGRWERRDATQRRRRPIRPSRAGASECTSPPNRFKRGAASRSSYVKQLAVLYHRRPAASSKNIAFR
jgi:hypothetical protein